MTSLQLEIIFRIVDSEENEQTKVFEIGRVSTSITSLSCVLFEGIPN
jgi:hypothetical protein